MLDQTNAQKPFRADHIGSLLRPPELLAARREQAAGRLDPVRLREFENAAIRDVVKLQEEAGLSVITDGEFRRGTYSDSFTIGGVSGISVEMTEDEGFKASQTHGHRTARRIPKVVDKIEWRGPQNAQDLKFLRSLTERTCKVTLPGPAYVHYRAGREHISRNVYPDLDNFWADLVAAYHKEMHSLADAGCTYLQLDETSLVKLGDERVRLLLKERGDDWQDLLKSYVDVVNAVIAGAPAQMRVGVHVCRSQDPSWQADVGYDPIAEALFHNMNANLYLLEFNNELCGTFAPLAMAPKGKTIVLGLLTSSSPEMEDREAIKRRIEDAAKFVPLDQLALSPHCGFATGAQARAGMTVDIERAKLEMCAEIATEFWG